MEKFDLIIIGSGPGGYVAAVRARQLGMKVAVIEKHSRLGGVCLNVGCIPSKALLDSSEYFHLAKEHFSEHGIIAKDVQLDLSTMMSRKNAVVEDLTGQVKQLLSGNDVRIIKGMGRLAGRNEVAVSEGDADQETVTYEATDILLATGSEPVAIPGMPYDGERIVTSTEALSFESVPDHLGIVGGGYIGLELGSVWRRLGAKVTVIEMLPKIAFMLDGQVNRTLQRLLAQQGISFQLATKVVGARVSDNVVEVELEKNGKNRTETFDRLMIAVGRRPMTGQLGLENVGIKTSEKSGHIIVNESYQTTVPNIYAIGDLTAGPMLAHKASAEGIAAVECMAGLPGEVNYDAIPSVIYTWPEVASVGITEEQAKERNIPYCTGTYPFSGTGRARCMGEKDGFVKLIVQAETDRILGVHIIGPRAADMIAECVLAMEFGAAAEDIARCVHGHPTFSEALQEAARGAQECSIYAS